MLQSHTPETKSAIIYTGLERKSAASLEKPEKENDRGRDTAAITLLGLVSEYGSVA